MNAMIGNAAGAVWNALSENGAMNAKDLKKVAKIKTDKELYLAMGWLSREDKLNVVEEGKDLILSLK
ncbi:MAG: winged helix-turn-helix domain-containing protein [Bacteroidaceae bacterium]|nr:winged helix-turn-helix domain-containing protein [Bacteroidaceae bacterium]